MRMPEKIAMMAHNIQAGKNVPNKKMSGAMSLKRLGNFGSILSSEPTQFNRGDQQNYEM